MIVFKNYFKVLKKFINIIIIYITIFSVFSIAMSSFSEENKVFTQTKINISIIYDGEENEIYNSLKKYIEENANIVELKNNEKNIKDALFYRMTDFIIILEDDFSKEIISNDDYKINTYKVADSYNATYTEMLLNKYINTFKLLYKSGMNENEILKSIPSILASSTKVKFLANKNSELNKIANFYNFTNYTFLAISILIIGMITNIYNEKNIRKRNLVSKISYKSINKQLFLGHLLLVLSIWLLFVLISFVMYSSSMASINGVLYIINLLFFSLTALSLGFLVGNLVKNKEAQNGIVNVLALGSSFISGAFVPQELLGNFVLGISKFFPSYYYITNNNMLSILTHFTFGNLKPFIINIIIMIAFSCIFFIITNIITKLRLKKN